MNASSAITARLVCAQGSSYAACRGGMASVRPGPPGGLVPTPNNEEKYANRAADHLHSW